MDDRKLWERICAREAGSAEELLRTHGPLLRYIIAPILEDPREREECLADVTMLVWDKAEQYALERGSFTAWLSALARNTALNRRRSGARRVQPEVLDETTPDPAPGPEEVVLKKERAQRIRQVVAKMAPKERTLFYRKYYYLQSTAQIAAELGLTERAVEGRLHRLRKRLRKELGGELL